MDFVRVSLVSLGIPRYTLKRYGMVRKEDTVAKQAFTISAPVRFTPAKGTALAHLPAGDVDEASSMTIQIDANRRTTGLLIQESSCV